MLKTGLLQVVFLARVNSTRYNYSTLLHNSNLACLSGSFIHDPMTEYKKTSSPADQSANYNISEDVSEPRALR